jgi:hypothetical protein
VKLDLEIKGDPWYIGPVTPDMIDTSKLGALDVTDESDEKGMKMKGNDQYILFDLQTPRRFDFDVADEDNNTGYWSKMGTAYFITGIYFLKQITHSFSGGLFTQELNLIKQSALDLKKAEKSTKQP